MPHPVRQHVPREGRLRGPASDDLSPGDLPPAEVPGACLPTRDVPSEDMSPQKVPHAVQTADVLPVGLHAGRRLWRQ